jgi:DNA-binding XRE family transcriptional regulator
MAKLEDHLEEELREKSEASRDRSERTANKYIRTAGGIDLAEVVPALKVARENAGITLAQLSQTTGLTVANLSRLENGLQTNPTLRTLRRYADALGKRLVVKLEEL